MDSSTEVHIANCCALNCATGHGFELTGTNICIADCVAKNNTFDGIHVNAGVTNLIAQRNKVVSNGNNGIDDDGGADEATRLYTQNVANAQSPNYEGEPTTGAPGSASVLATPDPWQNVTE